MDTVDDSDDEGVASVVYSEKDDMPMNHHGPFIVGKKKFRWCAIEWRTIRSMSAEEGHNYYSQVRNNGLVAGNKPPQKNAILTIFNAWTEFQP